MHPHNNTANCICQTCGKLFYKAPSKIKISKRHFCSLPCRFAFRIPIEERFWPLVDKHRPDECWPFIGILRRGGYGVFWMKGKLWAAHRAVWVLTFGTIPDSMNVLHKCDNRPCVNPNHLFLGTYADNPPDMILKGRNVKPHGEDHPKARLNDVQVREIRRLYEPYKITLRQLGKMFGVSHSTIKCVIQRRSWRHIV